MSEKGNLLRCVKSAEHHACPSKLFGTHPVDERRMSGLQYQLREILTRVRRIDELARRKADVEMLVILDEEFIVELDVK